MIPWHRFLKVCLRFLFRDTCYEVHDEFDLSDQVQLLDFAVIRKADENLPEPDSDQMPDGLQDLKDHNLISYKSMSEPFDRFALNELIGHTVAYSKLQAPKDWKRFSDSLGLIALSTRKPSTEVMADLLHETKAEAIYQIDCAGWEVICVVINQASRDPRNWLWQLLKGDRTRWKSGSISAILLELDKQLKKMGILDPEAEAIEYDILTTWAKELSAEQLQIVPAYNRMIEEATQKAAEEAAEKATEQGIEKGIEQGIEQGIVQVAQRMISAGKSDGEIADLTGLSVAEVKQLRSRPDS